MEVAGEGRGEVLGKRSRGSSDQGAWNTEVGGDWAGTPPLLRFTRLGAGVGGGLGAQLGEGTRF